MRRQTSICGATAYVFMFTVVLSAGGSALAVPCPTQVGQLPPESMNGAICGDVDGNGWIEQNDATLANQFVAGLNVNAPTLCRSAGIEQCGDVDQDGAVTHKDVIQIQRAMVGRSSPCTVEGFGAGTNRTAGNRDLQPVPTTPALRYRTVTLTSDTNDIGTLRCALKMAELDGGALITFALGSNQTIAISSTLVTPRNTVIDGIGSSVTIDARNVPVRAALGVWDSNVAVRHVRIRGAGQIGDTGTVEVDGIQVAPKSSRPGAFNIEQIAIHRVSVTKSMDGGIDVNGCVNLNVSLCHVGATVKNVTLAENFLAANGSRTYPNGTSEDNGGGNLTKYGVTNVTMVGNFWDKNFRRNPLVDNRDPAGAQALATSFVDVRSSLVRSPYCGGPGCSGWLEVFKTGAKVNVVNSCFEGASNHHHIVKVSLGGSAYVSDYSVPPPDPLTYQPVVLDAASTRSLIPFSEPAPAGQQSCLSYASRGAVFKNAGAAPRDCVDWCFIDYVAPPGQEPNVYGYSLNCPDDPAACS